MYLMVAWAVKWQDKNVYGVNSRNVLCLWERLRLIGQKQKVIMSQVIPDVV